MGGVEGVEELGGGLEELKISRLARHGCLEYEVLCWEV